MASSIGRSPQVLANDVDIETPQLYYQVTVNSSLLDEIVPDEGLNLREAIAFLNEDILWEFPANYDELTEEEKAEIHVLSDSEKTQIETLVGEEGHVVQFDLPPEQTKIELTSLLPPIRTHRVEIDGFSQAQFDPETGEFVRPIISLSPAIESIVPRGLAIAADDVTVHGLSIYGFNPLFPDLVFNTISAGLWVGKVHLLPHPDDLVTLPDEYETTIPQNVTLTSNWLGIMPDGKISDLRSAFGIWLHDAANAAVTNNRIIGHDASGLVTGTEATNTTIIDNEIIGNGLAGMPDGIRFGGNVTDTIVDNNLICRNGGSGIYFYRTEGQTNVMNNRIVNNGLDVSRAAIFLSGNDHLISNNLITDQNGSGVAIAAYSESYRNEIVDNQFARLKGLSIDLITRQSVGRQELQVADGKNPSRDSLNRREDTANGAINSPEFLSEAFYPINGKVFFDGVADPSAEIVLYQVQEPNLKSGTLNTKITQTTADEEGRFSFEFNDFELGTVYSAIAYMPEYGTSEPARNTMIQSFQSPVEQQFDATVLPEIPERCRS
ncbi:right-handed parallel beta-helix repeat-containing protein [[Leptolyngbya] sp. PCC 7376]|uniref:right-handed parallel beta-helix repeat-containing protein n=1 Tax=[Leptolyngbya] sp. PCC 7376 TaxID=111781 RepID=UPI00135CB8AF|nr:right-handed parallel beta-helix repeat-containing protein [[Leptolyngbya] sp. PCC 7376]